jgi:spermidine synthase
MDVNCCRFDKNLSGGAHMKTASKTQQGSAQTIAVWLLVFATGWFVMLTELVGARILSPYFGNTIYVWGSVIGIFLLALAVGYAMGGRMTRLLSTPIVPAIFAMLAGLYVAATPLYQDGLSAWLYGTGMHVKWAALLAASILYGIPMVLLGGVSPYCIHIATKSHHEAGSRAGVLYAISTMGSFIGCLVTAFVLIPILPISVAIYASGLAMALIGGMVLLALIGRPVPALAVLVVTILALPVIVRLHPIRLGYSEMKAYQYPLKGETFSRLAPSQMQAALVRAQSQAAHEAAKYMPDVRKTLLEMETPYHHMLVSQDGPVRQLIFGKEGFRLQQTVVDMRNLAWHVTEYTQLAFAGILYRPAPKRVCVIGVGGGTVPRALEMAFPGVQVDAVDIDPAVIRVAKDFFYWRPSRNVHVYAQDGRSFINWCIVNKRPAYDWVILDAYSEDYVPFHLTTVEFVSTVKRVLAPDGILAANMCIDDDLYGCQARTYKMVFGNVTPFIGHRSGNVILISQNGRAKPLSLKEASAALGHTHLPKGSQIDPRYIISTLSEEQNWSDNGPVLTDMWAPVENLLK